MINLVSSTTFGSCFLFPASLPLFLSYKAYNYFPPGVIDNAHKVWADIQDDGVESEACLVLAKAHAFAVDAPKTGQWVTRPAGLTPRTYPDFMRDPHKPSYVSHKVLGRLFRECRDFEEAKMPSPGLQTNSALLQPGFQIYLESAKITYAEYASQVKCYKHFTCFMVLCIKMCRKEIWFHVIKKNVSITFC